MNNKGSQDLVFVLGQYTTFTWSISLWQWMHYNQQWLTPTYM